MTDLLWLSEEQLNRIQPYFRDLTACHGLAIAAL
jgi:hypothetical protein